MDNNSINNKKIKDKERVINQTNGNSNNDKNKAEKTKPSTQMQMQKEMNKDNKEIKNYNNKPQQPNSNLQLPNNNTNTTNNTRNKPQNSNNSNKQPLISNPPQEPSQIKTNSKKPLEGNANKDNKDKDIIVKDEDKDSELNKPKDSNPQLPLNKKHKATPPIIINELPIKNPIESLNLNRITLKYIYKRNDFSIKISPNKTLKHLRSLISSKLNLPIEDIEIYYNNILIDSSIDSTVLTQFFKRKPYSYLEVKKKVSISSNSNYLLYSLNEISYIQSYEHKVHIHNYPSANDLGNHINTFFRETMQIKDINIDLISNNEAIICFKSSALAFDFNRYLWFIKAQEPSWANVTSIIQLPPPIRKKVIRHSQQPSPRNKTCKRQRMIPMTMFYNGLQSFPYLSNEERRMKDYKESKKKWVSTQDFITSVGNYSMIQYKKYHPII